MSANATRRTLYSRRSARSCFSRRARTSTGSLTSVQRVLELLERLRTHRVFGSDLERAAELLDGAVQESLGRVDPPEVHVREVARSVAFGELGLLEPLDRL